MKVKTDGLTCFVCEWQIRPKERVFNFIHICTRIAMLIYSKFCLIIVGSSNKNLLPWRCLLSRRCRLGCIALLMVPLCLSTGFMSRTCATSPNSTQNSDHHRLFSELGYCSWTANRYSYWDGWQTDGKALGEESFNSSLRLQRGTGKEIGGEHSQSVLEEQC